MSLLGFFQLLSINYRIKTGLSLLKFKNYHFLITKQISFNKLHTFVEVPLFFFTKPIS